MIVAQFNSLIVTGNSRFLNDIHGNADTATMASVHTVKGTQTAATGAWTGALHNVKALYNGLTINYYLPYNGSGNATLNLTLDDGTTTGAVNCYYGNASRLTTHYSQGSNIVMTYWSAGSISVGGTATTDNRWIANANYADGNSVAYRVTTYYNRFKAGANKIFPYTIIMQCSDGRWESIVTSSSTGTSKARNTHGFRLGQIALMYANATYNENATVGDNTVWEHAELIDHRYSFNTANDSTNGTTAVKPVYLVGAINSSDGLFYLDATWWTQTLPTTANGKLYIYLGDAFDYYRMSVRFCHPIYWYTNGMIREFHQDSATVNGLTVAKAVPSDAKFTDTTYESKAAASGGTAVSLCTTGEKYTWNNKANRIDIPEYSTTSSYNRGDIVTYQGDVYICNSNISPQTWTQYNWDLVRTPDDSYLHSLNPNGAGSFSINREPNTTIGYCSFAEGFGNEASGSISHAEGANTVASGGVSHAEGSYTVASGDYSHAEGYSTTASGAYSHAEGNKTISNHQSQHVFGEWNIEDPSSADSSSKGNYVEIVGNGTKGARSNARTLDWDGNEVLAGGLTSTSVSTPSINSHAVPRMDFASTQLSFTSSTSMVYLGKSVTCPSGARMLVRAYFRYMNGGPMEVAAAKSSTALGGYHSECYAYGGGSGLSTACLTFMLVSGETAYYWAKYANATSNRIDQETITFSNDSTT